MTKQVNEEEQATTFNPLEGNLVEEDDEVSEDAEEESSEEETKPPEGDLEEEEEEVEEEVEESEEEEEEELSSTLKKATENIPAGRDYSKYSEEDAKYLRQMSNEAFEHFTGVGDGCCA